MIPNASVTPNGSALGAIETRRLNLVSLDASALAAFADGDAERAASLLALNIDAGCTVRAGLAQMRLQQLHADASLQPWLLRAIVRTSDDGRLKDRLIGHIGFHTAPDPDYLRELAPGAVEIGYSICAPYRRQGYAHEAVSALMRWANEEHGVTDFVFSISPDNVASLGLLRKLGALHAVAQIGRHMDPVDGPEDIYLLRIHMDTVTSS